MRADGAVPFGVAGGVPVLPRKASTRGWWTPVPQTDSGGQVEYTEAFEIIMVKELGKIPP